jgi:hypothetical protein
MPKTPSTQEQAGLTAISHTEQLQSASALHVDAQQPAQQQLPSVGAGAEVVESAQRTAQLAACSSPAAARSSSDLFILKTVPDKARAKVKPLLMRPRQGDQRTHSSRGSSAAAGGLPGVQSAVPAHSAPPTATTTPQPDRRSAEPGAAAVAELRVQAAVRRKSSSKELKLSCMLREAEAAQAATGGRRRGAALKSEVKLAACADSGQPVAVRAQSTRRPAAPSGPTIGATGNVAPTPTAALAADAAGLLGPGGSSGAASKRVHAGVQGSEAAQRQRQTPDSGEAVRSGNAASGAVPRKDNACRQERAERMLQHRGCPAGLSVQQVHVQPPCNSHGL